MMNVGILQFSKTPRKGKVKTRLMTALSAQAACELHQQLLTSVATEISKLGNVYQEIWSTEGGTFIENLSQSLSIVHKRQRGVDLGERLSNAISSALLKRDAVIVVGSDCPFIDQMYYRASIDLLFNSNHDLVLGPAMDGGYVLIGMKSFYPALFCDIAWGSTEVFAQTLSKAKAIGLSVGLLDILRDIDRPEDLSFLPDAFVDEREKGRC